MDHLHEWMPWHFLTELSVLFEIRTAWRSDPAATTMHHKLRTMHSARDPTRCEGAKRRNFQEHCLETKGPCYGIQEVEWSKCPDIRSTRRESKIKSTGITAPRGEVSSRNNTITIEAPVSCGNNAEI